MKYVVVFLMVCLFSVEAEAARRVRALRGCRVRVVERVRRVERSIVREEVLVPAITETVRTARQRPVRRWETLRSRRVMLRACTAEGCR